MAAKARHNLERAIQCLLTRNPQLANAVIADDDEVDELERVIDRLGMEILMRFSPVASDLRLVVSSMKISSKPGGFALLFSTHPPLEARIEALKTARI